ncbi:MAG TPA: glucoamylase family protein [Terriglobales bacterium]|jgi:hypothetical protein|nr:glucoamylase family protein [Terriglobales bacterium]
MSFSRRHFLRVGMTGAAALPFAKRLLAADLAPPTPRVSPADEALLDELERAAFDFYWNEADPHTGLIRDRANADGGGPRTKASIAATGFGLTALCIGHERRFRPRGEIQARVRQTLHFLANQTPTENGLFYHFMEHSTGKRFRQSEVSPIDTAILLCGALTCREQFSNAEIQRDATTLYHRVDWNWAMNGGQTFAGSWTPEEGFTKFRWDSYCESMMLYLLAMGSPTHPIPAESWHAVRRPKMVYAGHQYISSPAPLFVHQFSHAWFDFRDKHDDYANYFQNSIVACQAHREFCTSLSHHFPSYSEDIWGITASDSSRGYVAWGGPPLLGPIDGSVVPAASAGSLPFLLNESLTVLRTLRSRYGKQTWRKYGFVDAFNPITGWASKDVLGIDVGISMLMAENARSQYVWDTFMRNPEVEVAMTRAGFLPDGFEVPVMA